MTFVRPITRLLRKTLCSAAVLLTCSVPITVAAFSELTEAQQWIYDTPHLKNTSVGQMISYEFLGELADSEPEYDTVELNIAKSFEDGKRDVRIDFLNNERRLPFPDFLGYHGNPVIIATLEYFAQDLANRVGGGALYFRNRIRDGLAKDVAITRGKTSINGKEIDTTTLRFHPFVNDQYIGPQAEHGNAEFIITLSNDIPGGVVLVAMESSSNDTLYYRKQISINLKAKP